MGYPATVGACLALLAKAMAKRAAAEARLRPLAEEEAALRGHILSTFKKTDLNGARGSGLSLSVYQLTKPTVVDWDAFFAYARRPGNDDLLARSVNAAAWRERLEAEAEVPGVRAFTDTVLRVNRVGKKP